MLLILLAFAKLFLSIFAESCVKHFTVTTHLSFTENLRVDDGARLDGMVKKVPLAKIENKVTNFLDTTKAVRKTFLKKD